MNLLTLGKLGREGGQERLDPFYDVGTQLSVDLRPWFVVGIHPWRYGVNVLLGPVSIRFYRRWKLPAELIAKIRGGKR